MSAILIALRLLDALVALTGALPQIEALKAKLAQFKAEGRDPTQDEWNALFDGIAIDADRLDAADRRLNP